MKSMFLYVLLFIFFAGCTHRETPVVNKVTFAGLGTVLSFSYIGEKNVSMEDEIKKFTASLENDLSFYKRDSYVSKLNDKAAKAPVKIPSYIVELIQRSKDYAFKTDGYFDITYKSEGYLWDIKRGKMPLDSEVKDKLHLIGSEKLDITKNGLFFKESGVKIDLGGVAKGYAIDKSGNILKKYGKINFIVNYGGDMLVCGAKGSNPWEIGIRNPLDASKFLKMFAKKGKGCMAYATSGDYERFFMSKGKKYSHIIDPKTGLPSKNALSVTVVSDTAEDADVFATAVAASGCNTGEIKKFVEKFPLKIYTLQAELKDGAIESSSNLKLEEFEKTRD